MSQIFDWTTGTPADADFFPFSTTTRGYKITYGNLKTSIYAGLPATTAPNCYNATVMITTGTATTFKAGDAVDDYTLVANDILFKNTGTADATNGLYLVGASNSARYASYNTGIEIAYSLIRVLRGTLHTGKLFECLNGATITLESTAIQYDLVSIKIRTQTTTDAASITPNADITDEYTVTALAQALTINAPTGSPVNGQRLIIRILDNATARALTWNAIYRELGKLLPVTTTVSSTLYVECIYNSTATKWDVVNVMNVVNKFGVGSNYSEFEADGTLRFNGTATVYKDAIVPMLYKGGVGEAGLVTFVNSIKQAQFDVGKFIYLENAEAPHDYKEGSQLELHIHWAVNADMVAGDRVQWSLDCAFANLINGTNVGTIFCDPANPTVFGVKTMTVEYTSPAGGTPAGSYIYSSFGTISASDMANVKIGAGFIGVITRIAKSGGTDPANGTVFGLNMGIHYEVDTIGSRAYNVK